VQLVIGRFNQRPPMRDLGFSSTRDTQESCIKRRL
jgi:hypothetical protein